MSGPINPMASTGQPACARSVICMLNLRNTGENNRLKNGLTWSNKPDYVFCMQNSKYKIRFWAGPIPPVARGAPVLESGR